MIGPRLDRVFAFADQLSFLIPHEWVETDEEGDDYLYDAPNTDSGWVRVSLISLKGPGKTSKDVIFEHLTERAEEEHGTLYESGENIVLAWGKVSRESGQDIHIYWWAVAYSHGPTLAHEALFSYTVLLNRWQTPENMKTVALLGDLVSEAQFQAPKLA